MNAAPQPLFTRFAGFIGTLRKSIAAAIVPVRNTPARLANPLGLLLYRRLGTIMTRLHDLLARIEAEAGQPRPHPRARHPRPRASSPAEPAAPAAPQPKLPRRFGWIARHLPEAPGHAQSLRHFLCEPETEALIASDPRIGRLLRPLCHMLGIDLRLIYRMVPPHDPSNPNPDLTRRHPLLRETARPPRPHRPDRPPPRPPRAPPPPRAPNPSPLRAPTLDDVQSLLDRVFSRQKPAYNPDFIAPDFLYVHPK